MDLVKTKYSELATLKGWFPDKESAYYWCGPGLRFPFTHVSFLEAIHWQNMPAYSLLNEEEQLIAFGQYYEKKRRCHLARLAVSPLQRSKGVGRQFVSRLMSIGMEDLGTEECSLFVVNCNKSAIRCYESLGFNKQKYPPDEEFFEGIDFMLNRND